ncbi:MAG: hypothetical protein FWB76_06895 [Oscillospiraceae bacterium]|nr:hypothetical protein [Oscillospiraceae bacterium]
MTTWKDDYLAMVRNRVFCLGILVVGLSFLLGYTFILDPADFTISMIGLEHPWLFRLWGLTAAFVAVLNNCYMMRRYDFQSKFFPIAMVVGCIGIALTTNIPTTEDWGLQLVAHWGTAIVFGVCMILPASLLLLRGALKQKSRLALIVLIALVPISLGMLTWLIIDKGGIAQQVIIVAAMGALAALNFTNLFKDLLPEHARPAPSEKQEAIVG